MDPERWHRIDDLLTAALDVEADQRASFLAAACAGDAELKGAVEELLRDHEQLGDFLADGPTARREESGALLGQRIGAYRVMRKLGQGGMGAVYLAERADEEYRKQVALKIIKRGMDTDAIFSRFRRERQILASLQHPNIAMLLDGGTSPDGLPYFVMEYIEGQPLLEYCDSRRQSIRERLILFRTICSAVHYAHHQQVVHRDLKPGNILVTGDGIPKLVDFGIAKLLAPDTGAGMAEATGTGVKPMTPEYASPEQLLGKPITAASDIYSLGVVLYELLSGRRPFANSRDIQARVTSQVEPVKPSLAPSQPGAIAPRNRVALPSAAVQISSTRATTPTELRRQLAGDLDTIVLKAMHVNLERRYASAQALSEDIQRHLDSLPIVARRDGAWYRSARFLRRHRASILVASLTSAAMLLIASGVVLIAGKMAPGARNHSIAVLPLKNLSSDPEEEFFSEGLTDELIARLASLEGLRVISHTSVMQYKDQRKPLPVVAKELNVDTVVEGSVLRAGDRVRITAQLIDATSDRHLWAETYERDHRDILTLQNEVTREIAKNIKLKLNPADQQRLAVSRQVDPEAYADYLRGRFHWSKRTPADLWAAVRYFEQAIARDPSYASAYAGLADSYALIGGYELEASPKEVLSKARAAASRALEIDERLAEAHTSLAVISQNYDWDWQASEREYKRAIELDPNYATAHHWYGELLSYLGRFDESFAEFKRAEQLDPHSLIIASDKGVALYYSRQYELAIQQLRKVLETDPQFPRASTMIAFPLVEVRRYAEALAELKKWPSVYGESQWDLVFRSYIYGRSGESELARRSISQLEERYGQLVDPRAMVIASIGAGATNEALAWLEKCYRERCVMITNLKVDPMFDPLRGDPHFQQLLGSAGFNR